MENQKEHKNTKNLIGQTFGYLTVLEKAGKTTTGHIKWTCQCSFNGCGNIVEVAGDKLRSGRTKTCGQHHIELITEDLTGKTFGRWKVLRRSDKRAGRKAYWECECSCSNHTVKPVRADQLMSGESQSCGCLHGENNFTDLRGRVFGHLIALEKTDARRNGSVMWKCECDCGKIIEVREGSLTSGHTTSCGCETKKRMSEMGKARFQDYTGQILNGIQIVRMADEKTAASQSLCWAICPSCKQEWKTRTADIKNGKATKCFKCAGNTISIAEKELLDRLEERLELTVERQYQIENRFFDGCIQELNLLIESDGSYWHDRVEQVLIDEEKDRLAAENGFKLLRVKNNKKADVPVALDALLRSIFETYSQN